MFKGDVYKSAFKVCAIIFILGLAELTVLSVIFGFSLQILYGVLFGCAVASLNFLYLAYCVKKSVDMSSKAAQAYMSGTYMTRMLIIAGATVIAAKVEQINIWAAVLPFTFSRIGVFILNYSKKEGK